MYSCGRRNVFQIESSIGRSVRYLTEIRTSWIKIIIIIHRRHRRHLPNLRSFRKVLRIKVVPFYLEVHSLINRCYPDKYYLLISTEEWSKNHLTKPVRSIQKLLWCLNFEIIVTLWQVVLIVKDYVHLLTHCFRIYLNFIILQYFTQYK